MSDAHNDGATPYRREARQFVRDLRQDAQRLGRLGSMPVAVFVERAAGDAERAWRWPSQERYHRFLVELTGDVRSEWRVQAESDRPQAQFYEALADRLDEIARAELG